MPAELAVAAGNRFEPRVKKRRLNHYGWLMQPRAEIKRKMAQGFTEI